MWRLAICLVVNIVLLCCWRALADTEYVLYKDPKQSPSARAKDLFGRMTLEEKIGQMTQIDRTIATPEVMKTFTIGK